MPHSNEISYGNFRNVVKSIGRTGRWRGEGGEQGRRGAGANCRGDRYREAGARKRKAVSLATLFGASPGIRRFPEADVGCWEFRGEILAAITVFLAILAAGRFVPPGKPFHRFSRSSLSPSRIPLAPPAPNSPRFLPQTPFRLAFN